MIFSATNLILCTYTYCYSNIIFLFFQFSAKILSQNTKIHLSSQIRWNWNIVPECSTFMWHWHAVTTHFRPRLIYSICTFRATEKKNYNKNYIPRRQFIFLATSRPHNIPAMIILIFLLWRLYMCCALSSTHMLCAQWICNLNFCCAVLICRKNIFAEISYTQIQ